MEAARSSETLVSHDLTIRRHNAEDHDLNLHCRENLKVRITNVHERGIWQELGYTLWHGEALNTEIWKRQGQSRTELVRSNALQWQNSDYNGVVKLQVNLKMTPSDTARLTLENS
jgi:hypothetical protein